jgi:hypothetical protein
MHVLLMIIGMVSPTIWEDKHSRVFQRLQIDLLCDNSLVRVSPKFPLQR